jgi:rhodanese-related sulfurtransferase
MPVTRLPRAFATSAAILALSACAARTDGEPFETLSLDGVERMLGQADVVIVDANTREIFERHHLPGARHWKSAPLAQLLPPEKEKRVVFYCASPS